MKIIELKAGELSKGLDALRGTLALAETKALRAAEKIVQPILEDVFDRKDAAVAEYTRKFDGADVLGRIEVTGLEIDAALKGLSRDDRGLLELAASRIEAFHKKQIPNSWSTTEPDGTILGQRVTPIDRVGIYVPGGKASYPSTVLMNAIPAKIAGVDSVVMVTPPGKDGINPYVLAAAKIAKVDRVFRVGGAQAIAALAYGTETIPKVDKITGPGNIYVATAKRLVYGVVDIDMIAGPSEILIINDGTGDARWIAMDMLSQAEHDELSRSVLITTSKKMAEDVTARIKEIMPALKRREIASASLKEHGGVIIVENLEDAAELSNHFAPEHLELFVKRPKDLLKKIRNAGAIFLGANTPEAAGDYLAGPNHTLPTGGTARFSSPLGVEDFVKKSSVIGFSEKAAAKFGAAIKRFADIEGLEAHGLSAWMRVKKP